MPSITKDRDTATLYAEANKATLVRQTVPLVMNQSDNDCGIYALYIALNHHSLCQTGKTYYLAPRKREQEGAKTSIRQIAKLCDITVLGELFGAKETAQLATICGAERARLIETRDSKDFCAKVSKAIDGDQCVMVPYCVDKSGDPKFDGTCPHWCLVFGYYADHLLATHWGEYFDWPADDLARSNAKINVFAASSYEKSRLPPTETGQKGKSSWDPATPQDPEDDREAREVRTFDTVPLDKMLQNKIVLV